MYTVSTLGQDAENNIPKYILNGLDLAMDEKDPVIVIKNDDLGKFMVYWTRAGRLVLNTSTAMFFLFLSLRSLEDPSRASLWLTGGGVALNSIYFCLWKSNLIYNYQLCTVKVREEETDEENREVVLFRKPACSTNSHKMNKALTFCALTIGVITLLKMLEKFDVTQE